MHTSIKLNTPCELINLEPLNPLISKCQIKVCYVGEEPNRNGTIITKETAKEMANSLPGCPIVGFFNEEKEDFEEHNKIIDISNGKWEIKDTTRPYGFVDLNAKAWFQKFEDDGVEHEYLMTEGYLWTGQYPETKRILARGNNQSMELDGEHLEGRWTEHGNDEPSFFIINEAIISKLCILGEDVEPCFEGASITNVQFSFDDSFKQAWYSMVNQVNELLNKGGTPVAKKDTKDVTLENSLDQPEEVIEDVKEEPVEPSIEEPVVEPVVEEVVEGEQNPAPAVEPSTDGEIPAVEGTPAEETPVVAYVLEEIPEYVALKEENETLKTQLAELTAFKQASERKDKEAMIESFYMLSDEDKKDVVEHIDEYSLDDIEAKLSIICVRNKVSFNLDDNKGNEPAPIVYNLEGSVSKDETTPAWVKAVRSVAKNKK